MRSSNSRIQYYVEGNCEKKLVRTLIDHQLITPGKTDVLNPIQEVLKQTHLRTIAPKTNVILIFDTDVPKAGILKQNLAFLNSQSNISKVIMIPQCKNLEDELIRCTNIKHIRDLLNCAHNSDFKSAFIEEKRLYEKLLLHHFDPGKLWSSTPQKPFSDFIQNGGHMIKTKTPASR